MPARFSKGTLQFLQLLLLTDTFGLGRVETIQLVLGITSSTKLGGSTANGENVKNEKCTLAETI